jgi:hypothetical protein
MASEHHRFDCRDFPAAANASCRSFKSFPRDVGERSAIAFQHRWLADIFLISPNYTVGVFLCATRSPCSNAPLD